MLSYSKRASILGALKKYAPGTSVNAPFLKYPRQISGKVSTPEYKVVGTEMGAMHTFSFSSEVVRCLSYP